MRTSPAVAGDVAVVAGPFGEVAALDLATGCVHWSHEADATVRGAMIFPGVVGDGGAVRGGVAEGAAGEGALLSGSGAPLPPAEEARLDWVVQTFQSARLSRPEPAPSHAHAPHRPQLQALRIGRD